MKIVFFLLNVASAVAMLDLDSRVHLASFVIKSPKYDTEYVTINLFQ